MTIPTVTNFDTTRIPIEGSPTFRADAGYVWSTIPVVIDSMNAAIAEQNNFSSTIVNNIDNINIVSDNIDSVNRYASTYLPPSNVDPTKRPDDTSLQPGDMYFNTVDNIMKAYDGSNFVNSYSSTAVDISSSQTITGQKTFTKPIIISDATLADEAVNKRQLDTKALLQGDSTKTFKVADAVNADEALSIGQLLNEIIAVGGAGSGIDADLLDSKHSSQFVENGVALDNIDPDTIFTSGLYRAKHANLPTNTYYTLTVSGNNSNVVSQVASHYTTGATYVRSYNTSWTAWIRIDNDGYATSTVGGTVKMRVDGDTLYITNDGSNA